ncbi:MAG: HAD family phosphatase, partial [Bacteroidia bacterium]
MEDTVFQTKAFLFDLNGTMVDDMRYHNDAWFWILTEKL